MCNYALDLASEAIMDYLPREMAQEQWAGRVFEAVLRRIQQKTLWKRQLIPCRNNSGDCLHHPRDTLRTKDWLLSALQAWYWDSVIGGAHWERMSLYLSWRGTWWLRN